MKQWKGFEYGVDFGGWLSQCPPTEEHYASFVKEEDFAKVKEWGLDHVRVPVDYLLFEDNKGTPRYERLSYLDFAVEQCAKNGLNMVLDLHRTIGYSFDEGYGENGFFESPELQEHFCKTWEMLASRYGKYGHLAFELLNEVTKKEYSDTWNRVSDECIRRIRAIAPSTPILLGGYYNNSVEALKDLALPQDENIIYNFHCYDPLVFTHQGATWIKTMDPAFRCPFKMTYSEYTQKSVEQLGEGFAHVFDAFGLDNTIDEGYFEALFKEAVAVAEERNVRLYCGEYGVIDRVDPEEALLWFEDFHKALKKFGIGSAVWNYKLMDFGLSDARMDGVRDRILKLIKGE
ncbi:MAG: cellulase family glycosylhydrolase [Lachnospiraceae bacterium]|nr:cellulase family glycosylhydrolase [Lachnospiraceae bacterium]